MAKEIDIEYCGGWGYGGPANRLKTAIAAKFPDVKINCHSAKGMTSKIEVAWIENGQKTIVWSKGKAETENGHAQVIAALGGKWEKSLRQGDSVIKWKKTLKVRSFFKRLDWLSFTSCFLNIKPLTTTILLLPQLSKLLKNILINVTLGGVV